MKLYNTLTKTVEEITPQNSSEVTVYTCGPTVYDYPHIATGLHYPLRRIVRTLKLQACNPKGHEHTTLDI